ncbi:MAG: hypothetical protein ACTS8Z_05430, partial [Candidatus Limnocylindrales bacterium]
NPTVGFDSLSGAVTLDTAQPLAGTASARITNTAAYLQEGFTATDDLYLSFLLRVTSVTGSPRIVLLSSGGTTTANVLLTSALRLRLRMGSTTIGADSAPLQLGSTYVVGLHLRRGTGSNGVVEAFLAPQGSAFGSAFASQSNGTWTSSTDRLRLGGTNGAVNIAVDDILLASGAMPGAPAGLASIIATDAPGTTIRYAAVVSTEPALTRRQYLLCVI